MPIVEYVCRSCESTVSLLVTGINSESGDTNCCPFCKEDTLERKFSIPTRMRDIITITPGNQYGPNRDSGTLRKVNQ